MRYRLSRGLDHVDFLVKRAPWGALLVGLLLALATQPAAAEAELTPHRAEYKVKIRGLTGRLKTELLSTADGFAATHEIKPKGLAAVFASGSIRETSEFAPGEDGVLPVHYVSNDSLSKDKTRADVSFDWDASELTGTVNDAPVETPLEGVVHDRVSIQYELMQNLSNGGTDEVYVLYDIDEFKTLLVRNIGEKRVSVPAGKFDAIGIQHQAENSSRVTTLWCVEELGYLPVVIEQHKRGKLRLRASLTEYEPVAP